MKGTIFTKYVKYALQFTGNNDDILKCLWARTYDYNNHIEIFPDFVWVHDTSTLGGCKLPVGAYLCLTCDNHFIVVSKDEFEIYYSVINLDVLDLKPLYDDDKIKCLLKGRLNSGLYLVDVCFNNNYIDVFNIQKSGSDETTTYEIKGHTYIQEDHFEQSVEDRVIGEKDELKTKINDSDLDDSVKSRILALLGL